MMPNGQCAVRGQSRWAGLARKRPTLCRHYADCKRIRAIWYDKPLPRPFRRSKIRRNDFAAGDRGHSPVRVGRDAVAYNANAAVAKQEIAAAIMPAPEATDKVLTT